MMISYSTDSQPYIKWNHVDGPLLTCRDGTPHWLTIRERIALRLGFTDIYTIEHKVLRGLAEKGKQ